MILIALQMIVAQQLEDVDPLIIVKETRIAWQQIIVPKICAVQFTGIVEPTPNFATTCLNALRTTIVLKANVVQILAIVDLAQNIVERDQLLRNQLLPPCRCALQTKIVLQMHHAALCLAIVGMEMNFALPLHLLNRKLPHQKHRKPRKYTRQLRCPENSTIINIKL
jgi:hypothetical protein